MVWSLPDDRTGDRGTGRGKPGRRKVAKINIDDSPNTAATYGVSSIPTLMIFKNGEVVDRFVGVQPKKRLQDAIDQAKA